MSGDGWYDVGMNDDDLEKATRESQLKMANRFWLPKGESKKVIFLDDEAFRIWEHQLKINGDWKNWFTCRKKVDPKNPRCPMCDSGIKRYHVGFLTVLDATGWENDKGELILYRRQLFAMKLDTLKQFNILKTRKTTLVGALFECTRTDTKNSPTVGNMFDFIEYVDLNDKKYGFQSQLDGKFKMPEPYDYIKMFEPKTVDEMMGYVDAKRGESQEGGRDTTQGGGDGDELY